ncbi:MAG TPA: FAD-dependent oxidoreductase [Steroidobacteraceae bacterium]
MRTVDRRRCLQWGLAAAGAWVGAGRAAPRGRARARVVIVGGGFAGSSCALRLRGLDAGLDVVLIDPAARYATCPMSNEVIAGLRELASITVAREGLRRAGVRVIGARVTGIDAARRRLQLAEGGGGSLSFDRLVVAPGIRFLWDRIEGYDEQAAQRMPHAWQAGPQTALLAGQVRGMEDGGVVAISVPTGPRRCPPGPYERASLIAHFLRRHKPRSKVLILDANNAMPKQAQFAAAWATLYPGMIEWIPMTQQGAVVRVDAATNTLYTAAGAHRVAVANVIPPQAPGELAPAAGLASDHGWCPVDPDTFESTLVRGVHVIGDACIAGAMPKSASAASSQAQQCALAVAAMLSGRQAPAPAFASVCYSLLAPDQALDFPGRFDVADGSIVDATSKPPGESETALPREPDAGQTAREAERWYLDIRAGAFAA